MAIFTPVVSTHVNTPALSNERDNMLRALLQGSQEGTSAAETAMGQKGAMERAQLEAQSKKDIEDKKLKQANLMLGMKMDTASGHQADALTNAAEKSLGPLRDKATQLNQLHSMLDDNTAYDSKAFGFGLARVIEGKNARIQMQAAQMLGMPTSLLGDTEKVGNWIAGNTVSGLQPKQIAAARQLLVRIGDSTNEEYQNARDQFASTAPQRYQMLAKSGNLEPYMNTALSSYSKPFERLSNRSQDYAKTSGIPQNAEPYSPADPNSSVMGKVAKAAVGGLSSLLGGKPSVAQTPQAPVDPVAAEFQKRFGGK